jgi:hypothetical protein
VLDRYHEGRSVLAGGWDEPSLYMHQDEDFHNLGLLTRYALPPHTTFFLLFFTSPAIHTTTDTLTMQTPPSTSRVLTDVDTIPELNRLKGVMNAKYADWDTKATESVLRFLSPEHKFAAAMSSFYKSLGEFASIDKSLLDYDKKFRNLTKAQSALTSAKARPGISPEVRNKLDIDKSKCGTHCIYTHRDSFGNCTLHCRLWPLSRSLQSIF